MIPLDCYLGGFGGGGGFGDGGAPLVASVYPGGRGGRGGLGGGGFWDGGGCFVGFDVDCSELSLLNISCYSRSII